MTAGEIVTVVGALGSLILILFFIAAAAEGWREAFMIIGLTVLFLMMTVGLGLFWIWVGQVIA